ncbi:uncharacterized protein BYT42DRAFT_392056 [Radiomyces spectabilis]|uniref:uncharacterized protein n=1 Tax=Radiomyces spectabilis TaxID=64574 RepID=UPI00221EA371|nr:uncharacterized protein BYT42DRAFT_392056 [Radiomyces spectabilis]KAI8374121.1 hypothetical protein BYT42DRAFT_392056 [Radiomyces spectabilis]
MLGLFSAMSRFVFCKNFSPSLIIFGETVEAWIADHRAFSQSMCARVALYEDEWCGLRLRFSGPLSQGSAFSWFVQRGNSRLRLSPNWGLMLKLSKLYDFSARTTLKKPVIYCKRTITIAVEEICDTETVHNDYRRKIQQWIFLVDCLRKSHCWHRGCFSLMLKKL